VSDHLPDGGRAVVERRAPREVKADDALVALWRSLDFFGTPPWGARAGAEILRDLLPAASSIWEPACGDGSMAGPFREYWPEVRASDIHPYGFGDVLDFLKDPGGETVDIVASNPPFKDAIPFLKAGLRRARMGVALLCRTTFMETNGRYQALWAGAQPLTVLCPFIERLPMTIGPWSPYHIDPKTGELEKTSTATSYSWFVFLKGEAPRAPRPVPPGSCVRLTRPDDFQKYAHLVELPLLANQERITA
jgi:hypothetical protein